ncbi:hypothetical protein [Arthrobacter sp. NicSoilB8]|uniref:hypothetical protein n=1 Tax=Arthrobacter sp. NicSoilB8 TaxID=2830998 RepID=UPI001CC41ED4|nr:hypothetical protein [Arthrobacter sp. NicSoilB8]BCW72955.1 hypothetical protein NicSoilB8_39990 [Arthrobacter sp. NicSoilB8]
MTLTISVYEKQGLCRGPAIQNASFRAVSNQLVIYDIPLRIVSSPGPLNPGAATYEVMDSALFPGTLWTLRVGAPKYDSWDFQVKNGETHEVWLSRTPG